MKIMEYMAPEVEVMETELDEALLLAVSYGDDDNVQIGGEGDPEIPLD